MKTQSKKKFRKLYKKELSQIIGGPGGEGGHGNAGRIED